jgi:cytochrome c peroxidase
MVARLKRLAPIIALLAIVVVVAVSGYVRAQGRGLDPKQELGQLLFFDEQLSGPAGQSCASCHDPGAGLADPDADLPVSEGVQSVHFGTRNAPSVAYAMYSPRFARSDGGQWYGGLSWDGRATGESLRDPLAEQARAPLLDPAQMNNPDKAAVVAKVAASSYAELFEQVWGEGSLDDVIDVDLAYDQVALSIAAFERTALFAPFDSQYDAYLRTCLDRGGAPDDCAAGTGQVAQQAGHAAFTAQEWQGLQLFVGINDNDGVLAEGEGAGCSACHAAAWNEPPRHLSVVLPSWSPDGRVPPLFTDFTYHNLGVPKNDAYPLDPAAAPDIGLGNVVDDLGEYGKFRVPTLRNVALTAPYAHNGYFATLKELVHFASTRDDPAAGWAAPGYPDTVNHADMGRLGLSDADEDALVAFLGTLSDGYRP